MKIVCFLLGFAITANAQSPAISPGSIQNAASSISEPIAPGEIVVLYGTAMGPGQVTPFQVDSSGVVSTKLAGTQILFNGVPAPIIYTSATQVAAIVPYEITGATAFVEASYQGLLSTPNLVAVAATAPGSFTSNATGSGPAAAVNQDGSINGPAHPAPAGSYISIFATGEGQTSPAGRDGKLATAPLPQPILPVSATVGGYPANVQYAGAAPGEVAGVMQVNVQIPEGVPLANPAPVVLTVGGSVSNTVTVAVQGASILSGLAVTSVSNASPLPLTALAIGTSGFNLAVPVQVQFSNNAGFSVTEQPTRVGPDGTIVAAVPIYVDPTSQGIASGTVSVVLSQGNQSTAPQQINIQSLPTVADYNAQSGDISRAVLIFDAMLLARRINELQAFQSAPGNTVDTSTAQSTLTTLLNAVVQARGDIDQLSANPSVVINAGTLPDGSTIQFDQNALDIMDRINGVFLTQTLATLGVPASPQQTTNASRQRTMPRPQASQLKDLLDLMKTETGINELTDAAIKAGKVNDWIDGVEAAAGALGVYLDQLPKTRTTEGLGVAAAILSDARTVRDAYWDLGAYVYGEYTGDSALSFNAVQAMRASRTDLYSAGVDLVIAATGQVEALNTASTIAGFVKSYYDLGNTLQEQADSDTATIAQEFASSPNGVQGVAFVTGQVTPPNNASASGQYEVQISSNGISFSSLSGPGGDYQIFINVNIPRFASGTATINIVDPVTHKVLGSKTIDLSNSSQSCLETQQGLQLAISSLGICDYCTLFGIGCDNVTQCYADIESSINGFLQNLGRYCAIAVP